MGAFSFMFTASPFSALLGDVHEEALGKDPRSGLTAGESALSREGLQDPRRLEEGDRPKVERTVSGQ